MLRKDVECASEDEFLGEYVTRGECRAACDDTAGCKFYIYGKDDKYGQCFWEKTATTQCLEGFREDAFDFYAVDPSANPSWESTPDIVSALRLSGVSAPAIRAQIGSQCWDQWTTLPGARRAVFEAVARGVNPCHKVYGGRAVLSLIHI